MSRRPVLLFDGECGFCRLWVERWRAATGDAVAFEPYQSAAGRFPRLDAAALAKAIHLVEPDGRVATGADAVFRALAAAPGWGFLSRLYGRAPLFARAAEAAYGFVAARRPAFSALTRALWGRHLTPPPAAGTARALLAALGLCYLAAFVSLGVQVRGLIGSEGVMPASQLLAAAGERLGPERYWLLPSLAWLSASDAFLVGLCAAGALAALALAAGLFPGPAALACWAFYLSLCAVGADFMNFQWDALLLEAGLLALLLAGWSRRPAAAPRPGALFLFKLLLAKLMLQSALVKLVSGDPSWRDLTALVYHYWTQPLPAPSSWYAHQLPAWAHRAGCAAMFAIETVAPLLLFLPRRPRLLGAGLLAALQLLIAATGNYGFFNLLTAALCVAALDDALPPLGRLAPPAKAPAPRRRALLAFGLAWAAVSLVQTLPMFGLRPPAPALAAAGALAPLRSINRYGLFAVMTKTRDEIVIEVSADGTDWRERRFRWKPSDPAAAPRFVAPHMPRLDWQMWFAALGSPQDSPWFGNLLYRLLTGAPAVEALLAPSPLTGKPQYARAALYSYRFATPAEAKTDGAWWKRERKGLFFPVVSLKD
ncbi:MAG: lipase maturation factor family protein [Elusimicrobiota bacterium]|nr:lipase maturation factor family protein [Elusimicrobiota bacterium]